MLVLAFGERSFATGESSICLLSGSMKKMLKHAASIDAYVFSFRRINGNLAA